jgi:NAD(P)-dependent dehydrogenase (short-subunit alcohol dehydrogenase family)
VFDINVWGIAAAMKHEVVAMLRSGGGAIVNTSSIAGHVGIADFSLYDASKHAVEGLTKTVALDLAGYGVRVNAVAPAFIATPMVERFVGAARDARQPETPPIFSLLALKRTVLAHPGTDSVRISQAW